MPAMKLLLIEDDELLGDSLARGLREAQFAVDLAREGEEAWHLLKSCEYDAVLLDWAIPGADGVELLRRYRAEGGKSPVLMLTARDATADVVGALESGADDYVVKPFEFAELLAR